MNFLIFLHYRVLKTITKLIELVTADKKKKQERHTSFELDSTWIRWFVNKHGVHSHDIGSSERLHILQDLSKYKCCKQ